METITGSKTTFEKHIQTESPDAYAKVTLWFENLPEERTADLQQAFNRFYAEVEKIVKEETSPQKK